ncbi:hypothetical protein AvCA_22920 [Azotobacter vinelandii CA]|uniref:Uncharacterized protein n=2 Tax=Azotobacter vinelandii TaxID=354 RepID=C1DGG9_AZOVD|nr:hypothetical protein Avin_22920 [Azotobacter vinelandii DJ]AGK16716.1 hypothetical protein AvCA_22920 [Azotobacter vinelandii CA]AGK20542.1 hypothetical protein AvCA6_22920 [Azotobacter vinelandii CA6]
MPFPPTSRHGSTFIRLHPASPAALSQPISQKLTNVRISSSRVGGLECQNALSNSK